MADRQSLGQRIGYDDSAPAPVPKPQKSRPEKSSGLGLLNAIASGYKKLGQYPEETTPPPKDPIPGLKK